MNTIKVPKLISSSFLLTRLVVFIVLLLLNILTLSFAAFNITASRTWEKFVSAGPSLAVFNSSVFLFLSMLLLGERKYSHAIPPVSIVVVEVCWTSVMTVLTFVSSILSTRLGPVQMCSSSLANATTCSSSILLLPVSWLTFFIYLAYSVALLIITVIHAPLVPGIWYSNILEIPWFDFPASRITDSPLPSDKSDPERQTVYGDAFHSSPDIKHSGDHQRRPLKAPLRAPWLSLPRCSLALSVSSVTPAWAKQYNVGLTRGLHNPFDRPFNEGYTDHQTLDVPSDSVQRPAPVMTKSTHEDRLHERDDDPFAILSKRDTVTTKVSDDYDDKTRSLQALTGFSNLPRWSATTTSSKIDNKDKADGKQAAGMFVVQNPSDRASNTTATTATAIYLSPRGRKSVSSLFPHDVREEDWNLPLTKPPFRNGGGQGWTTADATQDTVPAGKGKR